MSLGLAEPASETGDDSLSAITFDSDFETKTKRKGFHRPPPASPKSPYYSKPRKVASWRSLRTAGSMPLSGRMSLTPQKLWLGTAKQGYVPGTTVYREKEDMYDEIIELKKSLHTQKSDVDLMRTKLRRLEEENSRKDRQIEQLLDPGRGPDFVRTLGEKRPDTGWVINGLKQRIFRLEQQCKEKDSTISKLQTDMKTTNMEEMRIAMETYYEEIHRLQTLLASSEPAGKKTPVEKKTGVKKQKKMSSALLNLSRSVQELTEENQSLKEDLDRVLSNSPTVSKIKGYVDWSKPRLLRRIAELEKKISSMESSKPHSSEPDPPASNGGAAHKQPRAELAEQAEQEQAEEQERLRGMVKSLKGERSALQAQLLEKDVEVKRLLQTTADLEKELEGARESEKGRQAREQALTEEIQTLTDKCRELEETQKEERSAPVEDPPEARGELCPPAPSSRHSPQDSESAPREESCSRPPSSCSDGRREAAARTLQASWKAHKHKKEKAVLDEAAGIIQAALRGHLARTRLLSSRACTLDSPGLLGSTDQSSATSRVPSPAVQAKDSVEQEEAITIIQSVLRGHLARSRISATSQRMATATSSRRASAAVRPEAFPLSLEAAPGEDSEVRGGEATEDESGEPACPQPRSAGPAPSGVQLAAPATVDEVHSDDSDDIVIPSLPMKKNPSPF